MPGDESGVALEIDARLDREHPQRSKGDRHQRRLRVLGDRQPLGGSPPHDGAELVAKRRVALLEDIPRRSKVRGEPLAHADRLAALAWKNKRNRHADPPRMLKSRPKTLRP